MKRLCVDSTDLFIEKVEGRARRYQCAEWSARRPCIETSLRASVQFTPLTLVRAVTSRDPATSSH